MARVLDFPRRGEIYWADFDPVVGTEIAKTRPALIISNDIGNQYSPRVIVAAITSQHTDHAAPFEVVLESGEGSLPLRSKVLLSQIRAIDKRRLRDRIGRLSDERVLDVDVAIRNSLSV